MSSNQSIKRAFTILKAIAVNDEGIGVTEIANQVDLHKSTVSRMLITLEEVGAVDRLSSGDGFRIGGEIAALAAQISYPRHLITIARPILLKLAQATGETINLCLPDGNLVHYIDQIDSQYNLQIRDWTGYRLPMHATCDGKVFLAYRPPAQIELYLAQPLQGFTPQTITNPDLLREHLAVVQAQGYAWTHGEYEAEIVGVAVPVWGEGDQVIASICVGGPAFRFPTKGNADNLIHLLMEMSRKMTARLHQNP